MGFESHSGKINVEPPLVPPNCLNIGSHSRKSTRGFWNMVPPSVREEIFLDFSVGLFCFIL